MSTASIRESSFRFLKRLFWGGEPLRVSRTLLLVLCSLFFGLFLNTSFFQQVFEIYPIVGSNALFLCALFALVVSVTALLLNLLCIGPLTKPLLIGLLIVSSGANYFMNTYGIVMDADMLENILQTNASESLDLISGAAVLNMLLFGILPSYLIYRVQIEKRSIRYAFLSRLAIGGVAVLTIAGSLFSSAPAFASFFREHKVVRYRVNPVAFVYSVASLAKSQQTVEGGTIESIALDARIQEGETGRKLIVFVVGETARADRFSLNGYKRETNPLLAKEDVINLTNVVSSGTSTAVSVPAMFSHFGRKDFSTSEARRTENLLDVLHRAGVSVLWRDNNSDSKGVALRVPYEDFKDPALNSINDGEPRDEGMIVGLQDYIDSQEGDILIVLHQMGSHGPAYYKRYPKEFEVFTPVCTSNQLEQCSQEEIDNAYDNTIVYTDYFLSKVIQLLKENDDTFETAMLYFSDHGESLGEGNLFLHGYPYSLAPMEQKHVPAILWFGAHFPVDRKAIAKGANESYSHDNIFHTMLGLFHVSTTAREADLDIVARNKAYLPFNYGVAQSNVGSSGEPNPQGETLID